MEHSTNLFMGLQILAAAHLPALIYPGPDFAIIVRNSLGYSRKSGFFTALGITVGFALYAFFSLFGVCLLCSPGILQVIRLIGACYLAYIGVMSFKPPQAAHGGVLGESDLSATQSFFNGFLINALNPSVIVFFLGILSQVVHPSTPSDHLFVYWFFVAVTTFIWFCGLSLAVSHSWVRHHLESKLHWIRWGTGVLMIIFGILMAWSTLQDML